MSTAPGHLGPDGTPQDSPPAATTSGAPAATPEPAPTPPPGSVPPVAETSYRPAPTGPNWSLVLYGVVLVGIAVLVLMHYLAGLDISALRSHAAAALVVAGGFFAFVGLVGMARRKSPH